MWPTIGKFLIILGIVLIVAGVFLVAQIKIPFLGRLPGDIYIKRDNFVFYFPFATSLLISMILTLIFWLIRKK